MNGGRMDYFHWTISIEIHHFSTRELQLQFQFVSYNPEYHLTEWAQLLVPVDLTRLSWNFFSRASKEVES
jgi:hypothetical protein